MMFWMTMGKYIYTIYRMDYCYTINRSPRFYVVFRSVKVYSMELWHKILGYINFRDMVKIDNRNQVRDVPKWMPLAT